MDGFKRAKDTGALINTSVSELNEVKRKRAEAKLSKETQKRLDALEHEVRELKELVKQLAKGTVDV